MSDKKVEFENVGRNKQHKVDLFEVIEREFDIGNLPENGSYAECILKDMLKQCLNLLELNGIDPHYKFYYVKDKKINPWEENCEELPLSLYGAVCERDAALGNGRSEDYLASIVVGIIDQIFSHFRGHTADTIAHYWVLDQSLIAQKHFFDLHLLKNIHPAYSAGNSRYTEAARDNHEATNRLKAIAEEKMIELRAKNYTKEKCYKLVAEYLASEYQEKRSAATVKRWLKGNKKIP